ncbi:hypothetical protein ILYODFUR_032522 [Ilyodon furcidens]|uniref:Myb/SANT-like DNA-binding domain-containing protein n=1 Tax=Ilyodon furcidens TaxID=33524 RepID=A0ABV0TD67_9TELE
MKLLSSPILAFMLPAYCQQYEKVFTEVAVRLISHGFYRTLQCREKLKKLESYSKNIRNHNGQNESNRKPWCWFEIMDNIYGHRPMSSGSHCFKVSVTSIFLNDKSNLRKGNMKKIF